MDFGTAYQNADFDSYAFFHPESLCDSNKNYTVPTFLEQIYSVCIRKATVIKTDGWNELYSATQFESIAKSHFNIDNSVIVQLRTLTADRRIETENYVDYVLEPIYDSIAGTYRFSIMAKSGGEVPDCLGYKKISDIEYTVYFGWDGDDDYAINCTYNDTVKISSIERCDTVTSDLAKF